MKTETIRELRIAMRRIERGLGWQGKNDAACCGVTTAQCHALLKVAEERELSLAELAAALGLDKSTLSRTVESMVEEGILERRSNPADRRYVVISPTKKGYALCEKINNTFDLYFRRVLGSIRPGKRDQVLESIVLLADAIGQDRPPRGCRDEVG